MKAALWAPALIALALAAAGCGSSGSDTGSSATVTTVEGRTVTLGKHHGEAGEGRLAVADLLDNLAETKSRAVLCLKTSVLIDDARGKSGPKHIDSSMIEKNLAPTLRAELRRGSRIAVTLVQHRLNQVGRAVESGIRQSMDDPRLFAQGEIKAFATAAGLADRYGLSAC